MVLGPGPGVTGVGWGTGKWSPWVQQLCLQEPSSSSWEEPEDLMETCEQD